MKLMAVICAMCLVALSACNSGNSKMLSRSTAAQLISSSKEFSEPEYWDRQLDPTNVWGTADATYDVWKHFEAAGLVTIKSGWPKAQITWTDNGAQWKNKETGHWKKCSPSQAANYECWVPNVGKPVLLEVTGATQAENSVDAVAEFTWRVDPSEFNDVAQLGGNKVENGRAAFKRYDDGWRLVQ